MHAMISKFKCKKHPENEQLGQLGGRIDNGQLLGLLGEED